MFSHTKIAAIYSRDSRDDGSATEAFGIDSQTRHNLAYAAKHNLHVPQEYIFEEEFTGKDWSRPLFDKLKILVEQRKIEAVIIYKVNRISRTDFHALMFLRDFCFKNGVELHIVEWGRQVKDDSNDVILFGLQAQFGHIERDDIVRRTMRGKREKAEQNIWLGMGTDVYGYAKSGNRKHTTMQVVNEEAAIIILIFGLFADENVLIADITRLLNAQNIPSPSVAKGRLWQKAQWTKDTIQRILRDPRYVGDWYAFKTKKDEHGKTRVQDKTLQVKQYFPDLAIIDRDIFDRAQAIMDERKNRYTFTTKYEYLLNKRLTCICGYKASVLTTSDERRFLQYYRCIRKSKLGASVCKLPYLPSQKIDNDVWDKLELFIRNPDFVLQELREIQQKQKAQHNDAVLTLDSLEKIRADHTNSIDRLYDDYQAGMIPKSVYLKRKEPIDEQLESAERLYQEQQAILEQKILSDREIKRTVAECRTLSDLLDEVGVLEFEHKKRIMELLNITGELTVTENGTLVLVLKIHNFGFGKIVINKQISCNSHLVFIPHNPRQKAIVISLHIECGKIKR